MIDLMEWKAGVTTWAQVFPPGSLGCSKLGISMNLEWYVLVAQNEANWHQNLSNTCYSDIIMFNIEIGNIQ